MSYEELLLRAKSHLVVHGFKVPLAGKIRTDAASPPETVAVLVYRGALKCWHSQHGYVEAAMEGGVYFKVPKSYRMLMKGPSCEQGNHPKTYRFKQWTVLLERP